MIGQNNTLVDGCCVWTYLKQINTFFEEQCYITHKKNKKNNLKLNINVF